MREPAHEGAARPEGERIARSEPDERERAADDGRLRKDREHVLLSGHAAVKERDPGDRHEEDERRGDEHPDDVGLVHGGLGGKRRG